MAKRLLILEDGTIFEGQAFGADVDVTGEIVFNTGMTGYQESITDQSYNGQNTRLLLIHLLVTTVLTVTTMSQLSQRLRVSLCQRPAVVPATGVTK